MRLPVSTLPGRAAVKGGIAPAALLTGVVLLGFCLRIFHLQTQSLWFDEGWSWHLANLSLAEMAAATAADRSPPLYYAVLHVWLKLAGETEFAMRYLSLMADVTAIALALTLARALFRLWWGDVIGTWRPALAAGLLYAACPFAVWYAQETRMYALVSALCTLSSYWLLRWLRVGGWSALAASALAWMAAAYAHYYAVFLLPAQAALVLFAIALPGNPAHPPRGQRLWDRLRAGRRVAWGWLFSVTLAGLGLVPWLLTASPGFAYDDGFAFPLNAIDVRLAEWAAALAGGGVARALPETWSLLAGGAVLAAALGFAVAGRSRELLALLALVVLPVLSAAIAVRLFYPYRSVFHPRYLIYVTPPACVFLAAMAGGGAGVLPRARKGAPVLGCMSVALAGVLWAPALAANYFDPAVARDNVRAATQHVVEALQPGDLVVMSRDNFAVRYYYPMFATQRAGDVSAQAARLIAMPAGLHGVLADDAQLINVINAARPNRVRLLLWQDHVVDPQSIVESTLWPHGYQIGEYNFASIRLPLYQLTRLPIQGLPWQLVSATFDDQLELTGFWASSQAFAGDWFYVVLNWRVLRTPATDYRVFVHVLDADGQMRFQKDKQPLNELLPTSRWPVGQMVRDAYATVVPSELPAGDYQIVMGVYDAKGVRLPVRSSRATQAGDAVLLGVVRVTQR